MSGSIRRSLRSWLPISVIFLPDFSGPRTEENYRAIGQAAYHQQLDWLYVSDPTHPKKNAEKANLIIEARVETAYKKAKDAVRSNGCAPLEADARKTLADIR